MLNLTLLGGAPRPPVRRRRAESRKALDSYLPVILRLMTQWRACGQDPVRWWTAAKHQEDVRQLQKALNSTSFSLQLRPGSPNQQRRPPWSLMAGASRSSDEEVMYENFYSRRNAPVRLLKSSPFIRGMRSLPDIARTAAYLLFSEVLIRGIRFSFCARCGAAFYPGKKQKYCGPRCSHPAPGAISKEKSTRRDNLRRLNVASSALSNWIGNPLGQWRDHVENELLKKSLKARVNKSQWLGRCIRAAGLPRNSPKRLRLAELCTQREASDSESKAVTKLVSDLCVLIRKAQAIQKKRV